MNPIYTALVIVMVSASGYANSLSDKNYTCLPKGIDDIALENIYYQIADSMRDPRCIRANTDSCNQFEITETAEACRAGFGCLTTWQSREAFEKKVWTEVKKQYAPLAAKSYVRTLRDSDQSAHQKRSYDAHLIRS